MEAAALADRQEFTEQCEQEARRIAGIGDPRERLRCYTRLTAAMEEHGVMPSDAMLAGHTDAQRALRAQSEAVAPTRGDDDAERRAAAWEIERRQLVVMFFARQYAVVAFGVLALLPFAVAALRWGLGLWDALATFLAPGWPLVGVVLAAAVVGVLGRLADRARSADGLASLGVVAFVAGVVGMALGRVL